MHEAAGGGSLSPNNTARPTGNAPLEYHRAPIAFARNFTVHAWVCSSAFRSCTHERQKSFLAWQQLTIDSNDLSTFNGFDARKAIRQEKQQIFQAV